MDQDQFWRAKETCDVRAMADFLVEHAEALLAEDVPMEESPLASKDVLLFRSRQEILAHEPRRAMQYADAWVKIVRGRNCVFWVDYFKCMADASLQLGEDAQAAKFYVQYCKMHVTDPEVQTNLGNVLFRHGRMAEARDHYAMAMDTLRTQGAPYAAHNFLLTLGRSLKTEQGATDAVLQRTDWTSVLEEVPPRKLPELTFAETFDLPIFINCHNRLHSLQRLVDWLLGAGYRRIYLLDNVSTYPPLLAYYETICQDPRVTLVKLPRNFGYRALWHSGILHQLDIRTPYVYTDPDVLPVEDCPKGLVARLYQVLRRYPFIDKVGPGLMVDDVPEGVDVQVERSYCHVPVEEEVFFAPCDTTFALYAPLYYYTNFMSLRTRGRLLLRHLPWYLDRAHLPEDEQYYVDHADGSSTFAKGVKSESES